MPDAASYALRDAAAWLGLIAAPTFASMALWTALSGAQPAMICAAAQGPSSISPMTIMYLMMSAFHLAPWLRLISRQPVDPRPAEPRPVA
jgi:hypothetical protein